MASPGFWDNQDSAQKVVGELKTLKGTIDTYSGLSRELEDEVGLLEMSDETADKDHIADVSRKVKPYASRVEAFELQTLFNRPDDGRDVIFSIHAGTGGVDAMDFAGMLLRMYERWLDANGYEVSLLDRLDSEEA